MIENSNCLECNTMIDRNTDLFCSKCGHDLKEPKKADKAHDLKGLLEFISNTIKGFFKGFINNIYLIFLVISISYFAFYILAYYLKNEDGNRVFDMTIVTFWKEIAFIVFTAGIFTSCLKYLAYIKVFEKEFDRILLSDKYNERLKKSIESITLSEDYFLAQNNLEHIWEIVTLSKYRKAFPDIYKILKRDIKNEFFEKNNISYYYKNYEKEYNVNLVGERDIRIVEVTKYTIVKNSTEEFEWNFKIRVDKRDSLDNEYPKIEFEVLNADNIKFVPEEDIKIESDNGDTIKTVKKTLQGKEEYHIKRIITFNQNIDYDRECIFGCDKIIDDLSINLRYHEDLKVIFSPAWKVKYHEEELVDLGKLKEVSFYNRGILLPGEKFKLFIIKV